MKFLGQPALTDLSANENPFGPSDDVMVAIGAASAVAHRYPDADGARLKKALAAALGVETAQIVLGAGSCEVLELAARAILAAGDETIIGWPSFPNYRAIVGRAGASIVEAPLKNWAYDLKAIVERISERTRLIILANPNNPTGLVIGGKAFKDFLDRIPDGVTVMIDEAYREYVWQTEYADALAEMSRGRALVVTRTFSKAYGLAGLRVGYAIAPAPLARRIDAQRQRFNTSGIAQEAALAALADQAHLERCVQRSVENRLWLEEKLTALGLRFTPSQANFILLSVGEGRRVFEQLRSRGVLVKSLEAFGLTDCIRVSVGLRQDNERFMHALAEVLADGEGRQPTCRQAI
ncbi:histidinol-phosphate transaminase [Rhodoblastus sp.]|jgi:histidinol-phosphate aminotransferase|uniref:histidinol-phosphate transaminase n=1 Tax=Rhodoblastus sp. TaxID=1962975 RepID=UPI0026207467|nr:histidinol-phosphate transaminase [Rhodoblastus sp.]